MRLMKALIFVLSLTVVLFCIAFAYLSTPLTSTQTPPSSKKNQYHLTLNNTLYSERSLTDTLNKLTKKDPYLNINIADKLLAIKANYPFSLTSDLKRSINITCFLAKENNKLSAYTCTIKDLNFTGAVAQLILSWIDNTIITALATSIKTATFSSTPVQVSQSNKVLANSSAQTQVATPNKTITAQQEPSQKHLFKAKYLELVGGFKVPKVEINDLWEAPMRFDLRPNSKSWIGTHKAGYVVELTETTEIGKGSTNTWPKLAIKRRQKALQKTTKISPAAALWLDQNWVLTSGRKSYRSGYTKNWLAKVNLNTGQQNYFTIRAESNQKNDNFHVLQALGSGFVRIHDPDLSKTFAHGQSFLLGRGGYDVLGSPMGPALGSWKMGEPTATFLIDYPLGKPPAPRDPYYFYPNLDPNTYQKTQLPIWQTANKKVGHWQAGDVGGIAIINHPSVKGTIATHNHARGLHDYRAQGDVGSGKYFLVENPKKFYSKQRGGNRMNHQQETLNQSYPDGTYARVGLIYDPEQLKEVYNHKRLPWENDVDRFDWPRQGLTWVDAGQSSTELGNPVWDDSRQLLWVAIGNRQTTVYLAAYKIIIDDTRKSPEISVSEEIKNRFNQTNR